MNRTTLNFVVDTAAFVGFVLLTTTGVLMHYLLPPGKRTSYDDLGAGPARLGAGAFLDFRRLPRVTRVAPLPPLAVGYGFSAGTASSGRHAAGRAGGSGTRCPDCPLGVGTRSAL